MFTSYRHDLSFTPTGHDLVRPLHAAGLVVIARNVPDVVLSHLMPDSGVADRNFTRRQLSRAAALLGGRRASWAQLWEDYRASGAVPDAPAACPSCKGNGWDLGRYDVDGQLCCVDCGGARWVSAGPVAALPFPALS